MKVKRILGNNNLYRVTYISGAIGLESENIAYICARSNKEMIEMFYLAFYNRCSEDVKLSEDDRRNAFSTITGIETLVLGGDIIPKLKKRGEIFVREE